MKPANSTSIQTLADLIQTVHRLRAPDGCPWDQEQTHQTLRQYLIEEAYEVVDVLDTIKSPDDLKNPKIANAFREELGDLLMQVLLHAEMASETQAFNFYDVAATLNEKLIRRHPHVFSDVKVKAGSSAEALTNWEKEKAKEKKKNKSASVLDGVPRHLPSLQRASRVLEKVTAVGFDWQDLDGPLAKVQEEFGELLHEVNLFRQNSPDADRTKIEAELGDLFLSLSHLASSLKINPEDSLRTTLTRFECRFRHIERRLRAQGKTPEESDLAQMDQYWNEAKLLEKVKVWGLSGGVAAGKSTVARLFSERGIPIIDADLISRELSLPSGAAYAPILARFGTADRVELRKLVFGSEGETKARARADLEAILHPLIQDATFKKIAELAGRHPFVIYEAALLVETGGFKSLAGLMIVEAPEELRLQRLVARSGISPEVGRQIIQAQITSEERLQHANYVFHNSGNIQLLEQEVTKFLDEKRWNT